MGTHLVDLSRWILQPTQGEMTRIKGVITREKWQSSHDETAAATVKVRRRRDRGDLHVDPVRCAGAVALKSTACKGVGGNC